MFAWMEGFRTSSAKTCYSQSGNAAFSIFFREARVNVFSLALLPPCGDCEGGDGAAWRCLTSTSALGWSVALTYCTAVNQCETRECVKQGRGERLLQ